MKVLIVDWLGRAGIAQCTHALMQALAEAQIFTEIVTVAGRELTGPNVSGLQAKGNRIARHHALARHAAIQIQLKRPDSVVVQNYIVPSLERPVIRAVREVGARLIWFIHDHAPHSPLAGTTLGLAKNLSAADIVVCHSQYVADRLRIPNQIEVRTLPLPIPPEYHIDPLELSLVNSQEKLLALHFGVLKRKYKGTKIVEELARTGVDGWRFAAVGVGAPTDVPQIMGVSRYVTTPELAATVAAATASILPYRRASQSAAVALSQYCGTVPLVTAVGGLPEQVADGETGYLIPRDAATGHWLDALKCLSHEATLSRLASNCVTKSRLDHSSYRRGVRALFE